MTLLPVWRDFSCYFIHLVFWNVSESLEERPEADQEKIRRLKLKDKLRWDGHAGQISGVQMDAVLPDVTFFQSDLLMSKCWFHRAEHF